VPRRGRAAAGVCRSTGLATTPANADDPAAVTPAWVAWSGPDLVRRAPPVGEYGGRAMRLRLGRGCLPAGLVGAWQQAKGGDAWWAAGRRAGPGRSASSPDRGSARATDAAAGPGPTTPDRAPRRPATGAAGRAAFTAGHSTATATCSTWSTAPGRWWRSWTGCGGSGGRASAALRGQGYGHGVDGWRAPPRGAARVWRHGGRLRVMDLLPGPAGPTVGGDRWSRPAPVGDLGAARPDRRPSELAPCRPARRGAALLCRPVDPAQAPC
jgi:hypothetical protein